jgi:predicted porin
MKKNLIALAVSAAMVAPVAVMADVKVYGIGQVELTQFDPQASGADSTTDVHENFGMSRVGVKASEDLGNGMTAIAAFEFKADTSDNSTGGNSSNASLTGRDSYVGLKGGFGTVTAGRLKSPYKYAGGVKYDAFVATSLQARGTNGGMSHGDLGHSGFLSNHLGYMNKFGPIALNVVYSPVTDDENIGLSAMYNQGGIEAFVAMIDYSGADASTDDYSATKFGGSFTTGPHKIMAQLENTDADGYEVAFTYVAYQLKMGNNKLVLQVGTEDQDNDAKDASYMVVGAYHNFSKTTSLFGGYRSTDVDDDSGETAISVGLRQKF